MIDALDSFLLSSNDPARRDYGNSSPSLGWLHISSDLAIWAAYLAIPAVIWYCVARRRDVPFGGVLVLSGVFILACGTTHLMEAVVVWWPAYGLAGLFKLITAAVSWAAVVALYRVAPRALALRSPEAMEREVAERAAEVERANAALRASEARFRQLADAMPQFVWTSGPDGRAVYLNRRWVEYTGLTGSDPDQLRQVVHPDDLPGMYAVWEASRQAGTPYQYEYRLRPATGGVYRWFLARSVWVPGAGDPDGRWYGTSTDVDDLKRTEAELVRQRAEMQLVFDSVPALIFYKDREHRLVRVNQEVARLLGRPRSAIEGRTDEDLGSPHAARYARAEEAVMATGEPLRGITEPLDTPAGTRWLETTKLPHRDETGRIVGVIGFAVDVTDRKAAEDALRASETRFRQLADAMPQIVWSARPDGRPDYYNRRWFELTGAAEGGSGGRGWLPVLHPDDRRPCAARWHEAVRTGEPYQIEYRFRFPATGEYRWHLGRALPVRDAAGRVVRWYGTSTDIHDQKVAEEQVRRLNADLERRVAERTAAAEARTVDLVRSEAALRESEERYRLLVDGVRDYAILLVDPAGRVESWNAGAERITGYTAEEVVGRSFALFYPPSDVANGRPDWELRVAAADGRLEDDGWRVRKDGSRFWANVTITALRDPAGRPRGFAQFTRDVTERRAAEIALRDSERRFRAVFDQTLQFIGLMSPDGVLLDGNRSALVAAGVTAEEVFGKLFWETPWWTHDPALQARLRNAVDRAAAGETVRFEASQPRPDGQLNWVDFSLKPFHDEAGKVILLIAEGRDMTDRKRAEEALRESEERFRTAFDNAPIGMALVAPDGRWLRVNRALCGLTGYSSDGLLAIDFQTITYPADLEADLNYVRQALAGEITTYQMEKRYRHKLGHVIHVLLSVSAVRDPAGRLLYFVSQIQDITHRKQAEEQLRTSLREKEVLLKEIHHRVKNNLQIVSTLLDLQSGHTADRAALAMFKESRGRVRSMALIHERLYRSEDLARVDFGVYVRQLADDLFRSYKVGEDEIRLDVDVALPPLPLDIAIPCGLLINELISNCLKHAFRDRDRGTVAVSLSRGGGGDNVLVIADDGVGFPPGVDFRNTVSFGLQLVNTLVEQLSGGIEVICARGTRVVIHFPAKA